MHGSHDPIHAVNWTLIIQEACMWYGDDIKRLKHKSSNINSDG